MEELESVRGGGVESGAALATASVQCLNLYSKRNSCFTRGIEESRALPRLVRLEALRSEMRFWATAMKSLPRTWLMSVAVRKSPWREAEISPPRRWDSMRWSSWRAWNAQKDRWAGLRNMRQQRSSENWNWQRGAMPVVEFSFVMG